MQINRKIYQPSKICNKGKKSHAAFTETTTATLQHKSHALAARGQMTTSVTVATVAYEERKKKVSKNGVGTEPLPEVLNPNVVYYRTRRLWAWLKYLALHLYRCWFIYIFLSFPTFQLSLYCTLSTLL